MSAGERSNGRRDVDARLAVELAGGATFREAASTLGISESTVRRRAGQEDFRIIVAAERALMLENARGFLTTAAGRAARTLDELASDSTLPPSVRFSAASRLLDLTVGRKAPFVSNIHDTQRLVKDVVDLAFAHLPQERRAGFFAALEAHFAA